MPKKKMTAEKAAAEISAMIAGGDAKDAAEAVKKRPELAPGLGQFEDNKPVSRGSGPPKLERTLF